MLVLQMSKATGWGYYLGTAGMNPICQDPWAGCWEPLPPLAHRFHCSQPRGSHKVTRHAGCPPPLSFPLGDQGEGHQSPHGHVSYPQRVLVSGVQGLRSLTHVLGSSQWCLSLEQTLVVSEVGRSGWGGKVPNDPRHHAGSVPPEQVLPDSRPPHKSQAP